LTGAISENPKPSAQNARERVYDLVREGILRGAHPAGSFIEEEQICVQANVSRTPVREAFHRLAAERFLELLPRRGAMVRHVTGRELSELYEARRLIEGYAVRYLCDQRLPAPAEMTRLCEEMEGTDAPDFIRLGELNRLFHREMVAAMQNHVLLDLFDSLHSRLLRVAISAMRADPARAGIINAEHRGLIAALNEHDQVKALDLLNAHLQPQASIVAQLPG
jgi:DNA-binding GntR family transcriptional regulator